MNDYTYVCITLCYVFCVLSFYVYMNFRNDIHEAILFIRTFSTLSLTMHVFFSSLSLERPTEKPSGNPCVPSPCGPYSECRVINNVPACSCFTNYIGQPPNCRPECVINAECPSNLACKNERCIDPCPGSCGHLAKCYVINHNSVCTCPPGYTGNALVECHPEPSKILYEQRFLFVEVVR